MHIDMGLRGGGGMGEGQGQGLGAMDRDRDRGATTTPLERLHTSIPVLVIYPQSSLASPDTVSGDGDGEYECECEPRSVR